MDTHLFTTASAKADWLENRKREIDEKIDEYRRIRDSIDEQSFAGDAAYSAYDQLIDNLLIEKDNLRPPEVEAWQAEAEAQARDEADEKATQASAVGTLC